MPNNIVLKAKLQAYSRAPFYGDYIRQPSSVAPEYNKDTFYVIKNGQWVDLTIAASHLGVSIEELSSQINKLHKDVFGVKGVVENTNVVVDGNQLIFTDGNGVSISYALPISKVDGDTIGLNEKSEIKSLNIPDEKTLKVVDVEYEDDGVKVVKKAGKLRVDAIYDSTSESYLEGFDLAVRLKNAEKSLKALEEYTTGTGGFLNPYNFGVLPFDRDSRNQILNTQAYAQLFNGDPKEIPDQTKIKNLYDGHIWVYIQKDNNWVDEGADTIVNANNDGILGAVTGVEYNPQDQYTKFKISIETDENGISTGKMSVNGLKEEFNQVVYKSDGDVGGSPNKFTIRTSTGAIKASEAQDEDEVIVLKQLNNLINSLQLTEEDIVDLVDEYYKPVSPSLNGGNI